MNNSYKMRMYRRQMWTNRYIIGGIAWGAFAFVIVVGMVLFA